MSQAKVTRDRARDLAGVRSGGKSAPLRAGVSNDFAFLISGIRYDISQLCDMHYIIATK
jgi:hypothetical protein